MKFARIARSGPDGLLPRLAMVQPEQQHVIDLLSATRLRLEQQGTSQEAALRLAGACFLASMSAALTRGSAGQPADY